MRKAYAVLVISTALGLGIGAPALRAQTSAPQTSGTSSSKHSWTMDQAITSSVREAWALGGKTEEGFFEIVQALAELSAHKRGVAPPDTESAGAKAGNWIKAQARTDPDQLLYVVVDEAVRYSARNAKPSQ